MIRKLLIICFLIIVCFIVSKQTARAEQIMSSYALAYPGVLPDNPLYKLKVLRDKLIPIFIGNPQKKIEFYLLQTDKGIAATDALIAKGNLRLAKETALKAEHNYTLLTYEVKRNKWKIDGSYYIRLEEAALKHQEILNHIIEKVSQEDKEIFRTVLYFSQKNLNEIRDTSSSLFDNEVE